MEILKFGKKVDTQCECKECGCQFVYWPGDIKIGDTYVSNVPEQFLKRYGGDQYYCEIKHYRYVTCPWCGLQVKIDEKPQPQPQRKPQSYQETYYDMVCKEAEIEELRQDNS